MTKKIKITLQKKRLSKLNKTFVTTNRFQKQIEKNLIYPKVLIASFLLITISMLSTFFLLKYLPPEIPLFFGLPESEDQIVSSSSLVIPSLFSLAILVLNATAAYFTSDKFTKTLLIFTILCVSLLSTTTTIKIMLLVGSF